MTLISKPTGYDLRNIIKRQHNRARVILFVYVEVSALESPRAMLRTLTNNANGGAPSRSSRRTAFRYAPRCSTDVS